MKKALGILLALAVALSLFGCAEKEIKNLPPDQVEAAYQAKGYQVVRCDYPDQDYGYFCHLRIQSGEEEIHFKFYNTVQEAQAEEEERTWHPVLYLFTAALGQPTWLHTTTYGSIEIEYTDKALYKIFQELT